MKYSNRSIVAVLSLSVLVAGVAFAASPKFKAKPGVTATDNGTTLQVCGALTGLGNADVTITVTGDGVANVRCTNPGNQPVDAHSDVVATGTTTIPSNQIKNGNLTFCVSTVSPDPGEPCPNTNWTATVTDVTFGSFTITVEQGGVVVLEKSF